MAEPDLQAVAFPKLSEAQMASLGRCTQTRLRPFHAGEQLFASCDRDPGFFVVQAGEVEIVDESGDKPKTVTVHGPGEFIGDVGQVTGRPAIVSAVARHLRQEAGSGRPIPLIVDPVMVATSGDVLLEADAIDAIRQELAPQANLLTPNLAEAARLLGAEPADGEAAAAAQAKALFARFGCPILLKGGHGSGQQAVDFFCAGGELERVSRPRLATPHTHGTGCVLSAAVAALLARGLSLRAAIAGAKGFVWQGLVAGASLGVGHGRGPVDCLFAIRRALPPIENGELEQ